MVLDVSIIFSHTLLERRGIAVLPIHLPIHSINGKVGGYSGGQVDKIIYHLPGVLVTMSLPRLLFFVRLIERTNSMQVWAKWSMSLCRASLEFAGLGAETCQVEQTPPLLKWDGMEIQTVFSEAES